MSNTEQHAAAEPNGNRPELGGRKRPGLVRRLLRRSWVIALAWLVVSVSVCLLIYVFTQPTYEAFSIILIEPTQPEIYNPIRHNPPERGSISAYLQTQVNKIKSDKVLEESIANPLVVNLPAIRQSDDPKAFLRQKLSVDIMDNTYMIRVALELADADQAATIVNTVVETYMMQNTIFNRGVNKYQQEALKSQWALLEDRLKAKKQEMEALLHEGRVATVRPTLRPGALNNSDGKTDQPLFSEITEEQFTKLTDEAMRSDLEYLDAANQLEAVKRVRERYKAQLDAELEARVAAEFQKQPAAVALAAEIAEADKEIEKLNAGPTAGGVSVRKHRDSLQARLEDLRKRDYDQIRQRLAGEGQGACPTPRSASSRSLWIKPRAREPRWPITSLKSRSRTTERNPLTRSTPISSTTSSNRC